MDNKTKQNIALLEARILALETFIAYKFGESTDQFYPTTCNKCDTHNPINSGYICSVENCCMGCNPEDDK